MGVVISKPAINIREQLTELKATQGYEERQFHFDGLVTNGTFDTDLTGWTTGGSDGGSITQNSGVADIVGNSYLAQQLTGLTAGATYQITASVTETNSQGSIRIGTSENVGDLYDSPTFSSATEYSTYVVPAGSGLWVTIKNEAGIGVTTDYSFWDNISVYEVDPNDSNKVIHTMPKGWKPLHVFEDGALQREGSAYDYTVEYDGFNYVIKETVAPVAPYSTTVIGVRA